MHEVWARGAWALIDMAELGGLPREHVFAALPWDAVSVRSRKTVAWADYCTLCENVARLAGDGFEDLVESRYHHAYPELRAAFGTLVDTKPLMRFLMTIGSPLVFSPVEHRFDDLGGRHVRVTTRLRAGVRPCEAWFRRSIGALRCVPRLLDMPSAEVTAEIGPDFGIYNVILPPNRTLAARLKSAITPIVRVALGRELDGSVVTATIHPATAADGRRT